jgi:hypothetical protein
MVWGCLTYRGVDTSAKINGNMNSVTYIETLNIHKLIELEAMHAIIPT